MKKEFYKKSLECNADFKSTRCENTLSNLYSNVTSLFPENKNNRHIKGRTNLEEFDSIEFLLTDLLSSSPLSLKPK